MMMGDDKDDLKPSEGPSGTSPISVATSLLDMSRLTNAVLSIEGHDPGRPPLLQPPLAGGHSPGGASTFYLASVLPGVNQITEVALHAGKSGDTEDDEPEPSMHLDSKIQDEELLKDVLYSVVCSMGKSHEWKVMEKTNVGVNYGRVPTTATIVTLKEVMQLLQDTFHSDDLTLQSLFEEAQQRKPAEFYLNLTVLEADIQSQMDARGPTNSFIRIKVGPNFLEEHETPQVKGMRPKWKHDMRINVRDLYRSYLLIELWQEIEDTRRRRLIIPESLKDPIRPILLADLLLPLKDVLECGIPGWYDLKNHNESNISEENRIYLSGYISCVSDIHHSTQESHYTLLRFFRDHQIKNSQSTHQQIAAAADSSRGSLPASVRAVLMQYALVLNISKASQLLSWWSNVTNFLSFVDWCLVLTQFNDIKTSLVLGSYSDEEQQYLSSSILNVIENCQKYVEKLEDCFPVAHHDRSKSQLKFMLQTMMSIQAHPNIRSLLKSGHHSNIQDVIKAALGTFSSHWWNKMEVLLKKNFTGKEEQLQVVFTATNEVYVLLQNFREFYDKIFSKEVEVCCIKIVYSSIVKNMMEAVEPIIISCCQAIPVAVQLIGDDGIECDFLLGSYLMKIYQILSRISRFRCLHISSLAVSQTGVEQYYKMFEDGVDNQLALTTDREYLLIGEITAKDTLEPISSQTQFSPSLLEVTAIPYRIKVWWLELTWPNSEYHASNMIKVLKKLIFLSLSYCKNLIEKTDYVFEGSDGMSQQYINKKACVVITNIDNILQEVKKLPDILGYKILETQVGSKYNSDVEEILDEATSNIGMLLHIFITTVIDRREEFLAKSMITACKKGDSSAFLKGTLYPAIDLLRELLVIHNMQEFLKCLWDNVIKIANDIVTDDNKRDPVFYKEMLEMLQTTFKDITPDSGEALDAHIAETEKYSSLIEDLKVMSMSTQSLISLYYHERHKEQDQESVPSSASLVIRTWFTECSKLIVRVLMARDITVPPEECKNEPLEYYIKIQLLPDDFLQETRKTMVVKADPATFDMEFEFDVGNDSENIQTGLLLLTLKDENRTRSNVFLGESIVPLADITSDTDSVKNMYLRMTAPGFGEGCQRILQTLCDRESDKEAAAFLRRLRKRHGIVVHRKISRIRKLLNLNNQN